MSPTPGAFSICMEMSGSGLRIGTTLPILLGNPVIDPTGEASGSYRVTRGGSWLYDGPNLRSAERNLATPRAAAASNGTGLRVGFQYTGRAHG